MLFKCWHLIKVVIKKYQYVYVLFDYVVCGCVVSLVYCHWTSKVFKTWMTGVWQGHIFLLLIFYMERCPTSPKIERYAVSIFQLVVLRGLFLPMICCDRFYIFTIYLIYFDTTFFQVFTTSYIRIYGLHIIIQWVLLLKLFRVKT